MGSSRIGSHLPRNHWYEETGQVTIKGIDEADSTQGEVSWIAPVARALLKAKVGDEVSLVTPVGVEKIEVVEVAYPAAS